MPRYDVQSTGYTPSPLYKAIIVRANAICQEYLDQGYDITLRQLYYQFVARGLMANLQKNYKLLGEVCKKAREHGLMDWDYLVDRTRSVVANSHFTDPEHALRVIAEQYRLDRWADAPHIVEVWVEKEALAGIVDGITEGLDVPSLPCRGYVSTSQMWQALTRLVNYVVDGKEVTVLHLGDYDPSGTDMSRDNEERLHMYIRRFAGVDETNRLLHFKRIALTAAQITLYNPPPAPAKRTDSRYKTFVADTGQSQSWELDALDPAVLANLISTEVLALRDDDVWDAAEAEENEHKRMLGLARERWTEIVAFLEEGTTNGQSD